MIRNCVFGIFASASICIASRWDGARATKGYSLIATDVSPLPTQVPFLGKRGGELPLTVCGFVGGSNAFPATCSVSSACAWNTDYSIVGCCHTSKAKGCLFFTGCEDIKSTHTSDDPMIYTCRGTSTCFQNSYDGGYKQWGCGFSPTTILLTYSGQSPDAPTVVQSFIGTKDMAGVASATTTSASSSTSQSDTKSSSSATSSGTSTAASSSSSSTTTGSTSSSSTSATAAPANAPAKKGVSTGTIVGSVVGALALGAIIAALLAWFLIRRRKQNNKKASQMSQEPMSISGNPEKEGPNSILPGYVEAPAAQPGLKPPGSYQAYNPPPPSELDASQGAGYQNIVQRNPNRISEVP